MPRYGHAVLGGTFDHLHVGHAALLAAAFRAGRRVSVGVTTDDYLAAHPKPDRERLQSFATRRAALARFLAARYGRRRWRLVPLADRFGRSVEAGVDVLVVSAETVEGGAAVNAERRRRGSPAVPLVVVPLVLADDLVPVSARRIRSGEIDREGRRRSPIRVGVATDEPGILPELAPALRAAFPRGRFDLVPRPGPRAKSAGAPRSRVLAARALVGHDLGVGVARRRPDGVWLCERSVSVVLPPVAVVGRSPSRHLPTLRRALRPGERNAFPRPRSSGR